MDDPGMASQIVMMVITAVITGGLSSIGTIAALRVHITYLGKAVDRHEEVIAHIHQRIDSMDPACRYPAQGQCSNGAGQH